jgi:hypothetical protein
MKYHTIADHVRIAVDTDTIPSSVTLTDIRTDGSIVIREDQLALIKIVRRGFTDLFDAVRKRELGQRSD